MKLLPAFLLLGFVAVTTNMPGLAAQSALRCLPDKEVPRVFSGSARTISVLWQNADNEEFTANLCLRLLQASSATTVHVAERPWKKLRILPGQTVLESATVDFPAVKAETRFVIKWLATNSDAAKPCSSGRASAPSETGESQSRLTSSATLDIVGTSEVLVYPTNLLVGLKPLAGEDQPVGVFDPTKVLKPLLKAAGVEFEDLEDTGVADFRGKLAIIGPFTLREQMPSDLGERVEKLARKGAGVVWLQLPPAPHAKLQPSFQTVPIGDGAVVVAQASLVTNLADNPQAQLNLLHLCRLAREPEPPRLPNLNPQP